MSRSASATPVSTPKSARSTRSRSRSMTGGLPKISQTQKQIVQASKGLPPGLVSMFLPASLGVVMTNPRYESVNKGSFKAPSSDMGVGGAINNKFNPVSRGFSYSFPGMFQDTGIGSLEKEADRREMHIKAAKERLERLERLKIEQEEKRRIRDALREKKRQEKAMFRFAVTSLQSAFRGAKDREVVNAQLFERRQMMKAIKAMQSAMRGQKGRAVAHQRKTVVVGAATKIQRRYSARIEYKKAQKDIEIMLEERQLARARALEAFQEECATQVQAFFRGARDRRVVAAQVKKRRKKLRALKSKEADMKARLAAMAKGGKKGGKAGSRAGSPKAVKKGGRTPAARRKRR